MRQRNLCSLECTSALVCKLQLHLQHRLSAAQQFSTNIFQHTPTLHNNSAASKTYHDTLCLATAISDVHIHVDCVVQEVFCAPQANSAFHFPEMVNE